LRKDRSDRKNIQRKNDRGTKLSEYQRGVTSYINELEARKYISGTGLLIYCKIKGQFEREWYENGMLKSEKLYKNGRLHGYYKQWNIDGELISKDLYIRGVLQ
jgi:hypothetical protein